jgi:hypothetical protein
LEIFNRQLQSDEEQVPALYLPEQTTLLYTPRNNDVPWAAISRELATALFPEEDPGRFAAGLKEVLAADSVEEAAATLDELGFAKLDTSVAGPTTLGEPVDTLGTETVNEGHVPPAEPQGEPGDGSEELTPEEAIKRLLGGDASPPTPPVVPAGAEPIGTSNGKAAGTSRKKGRPVLRSYLPAPGNADSESKTDTNSAEKGRSPVDEAGIRRVMDFETAAGRTPKEMPHTNEGYDIESCGRTGEVIRYIEVKSLSGRWRDSFAVLSRAQFKMEWDDHKDLFWLYVVEQAESDEFQIHRIPNPALKANHFMFDDGWRSLAEAEEEKEE